MARRAIPVALVVAAAAADRAHEPRLSFYALLVAVPAVAAATLGAVEERIERGAGPERVVFWSFVLALVVIGSALRAPVLTEGTVPRLATSALLVCLALFCVQALAGVVGELRRRQT
jgi:cyanate permease